MPGKGRLAKNVIWNLAGLVIPLLAAVIAIPLLIDGMGSARFGILTLAWLVVGYFSLFDLGLGRAVTQLIAKRLGEGRHEEISPIFWTALMLMAVFGLLGGIVVFLLTPWLVGSVLNIPLQLQGESIIVFNLLAFSLPFVVTTATTRGVLEAYQYFGWVNLVKTPLGVFNFLGPLLVLPYSPSLAPVVGILVFGRVLAWLVYGWLSLAKVEEIAAPVTASRQLFGPLFRFGGWMTVTNIVSPLMVYIDRFMVAGVMSVVAVAYYATPHEMVTKLGIIPSALLGVFFPAFAAVMAGDRTRIGGYFQRVATTFLVILFPVVLFIALFSREILLLWIGPEFAANSATVMVIFLLGVYVNGFARLSNTLIQSDGRPDITAKLHLLEFIPYMVSLWFFMHLFGVVGAALSWAARIVIDMLMSYYVLYYRKMVDLSIIMKIMTMVFISLLVILTGVLLSGVVYKLLFCMIAVSILFVVVWRVVLTDDDKRHITVFFGLVIHKHGG